MNASCSGCSLPPLARPSIGVRDHAAVAFASDRAPHCSAAVYVGMRTHPQAVAAFFQGVEAHQVAAVEVVEGGIFRRGVLVEADGGDAAIVVADPEALLA